MQSDLGNILGEKIFSGDGSDIYRNGIGHTEHYVSYILWDDVKAIYVSATLNTFDGIPSGEDRELGVIDANGNREEFLLSGLFRMKQERRQQFNEAYSFVLQNTSERLWREFIQSLSEGNRLSFNEFEMTKDVFYFHKTFGGWKEVNTAHIRGCDIGGGYFYINYQEPDKKVKTKRVGEVSNIPNIHIIQSFINAITQ
jgi:hypothetical protein